MFMAVFIEPHGGEKHQQLDTFLKRKKYFILFVANFRAGSEYG